MRDLDLDALARTQLLASAMLTDYIAPLPSQRAELLDRIRPRDEDWGRVFQPPYVEMVRRGYEAFWDAPELPRCNPGQFELFITACAPAFVLRTQNPASELFPGGYKHIAVALRPDPIWCCWKFVKPGERLGMAHNGLVLVDEYRFAWFPKPWRVIQLA